MQSFKNAMIRLRLRGAVESFQGSQLLANLWFLNTINVRASSVLWLPSFLCVMLLWFQQESAKRHNLVGTVNRV